jgi:hypothetical protein
MADTIRSSVSVPPRPEWSEDIVFGRAGGVTEMMALTDRRSTILAASSEFVTPVT